MIDEGIEVDLSSCSSVHVVANLLLQFLQEIPQTLLTDYRYEKFFDASGMNPIILLNCSNSVVEIEDMQQRLVFIKLVVESLPPINKAMLQKLVEFLTAFGPTHASFDPISHAIMRNNGTYP